MPIYEYKSKSETSCSLCKVKFEVRQSVKDEPLSECPKCGRDVEKIFSKSLVVAVDSLSPEETYTTYTEQEADAMGLKGGFAPDEIWD